MSSSSMSCRITPYTKYQNVRIGYAGLRRVYFKDIFMDAHPDHGYTSIKKGFEI
jgi:hypothetical protein